MSVNTIVVSTRSVSAPPRVPGDELLDLVEDRRGVADPVQRVRARQFDVAGAGDVLGQVAAVADRDERRSPLRCRTSVGAVICGSLSRTSASASAWFDLRAMLGDAARLPAASHHARNATSSGDRRREDRQHVESLLDSVRFHRDRGERIAPRWPATPTS